MYETVGKVWIPMASLMESLSRKILSGCHLSISGRLGHKSQAPALAKIELVAKRISVSTLMPAT
jgi:hypothetical protein